MDSLSFVAPCHGTEKLIFQVGDKQVIFHSVKASFHAEGIEIAAVLWGRDINDVVYLLDDWESDINADDMNVSGKVADWAKNYGLGQVVFMKMQDAPDSDKHFMHPLTSEVSGIKGVGCYVAKNFAPYKGLITHKKLRDNGKLNTDHYKNYHRTIERIKRLDPKAKEIDVATQAFLLAMCEYKGHCSFGMSNIVSTRPIRGFVH